MATVLIVDDEDNVRAQAAAAFEASDFDVVGEAADGVAAVDQFQKLSPDIVMLDIDMPTKSGMEALRDIIKIDADACVIMFTLVNVTSVIDDCLLMGAKDYVRKDLSEEELISRVSDIYAKHAG